MATAPTLNVLVESVSKILPISTPNDVRAVVQESLTSMDVKSYGTLIFPHNKSHQADFIRVPDNINVNYVKEFLYRYCCHERPSLVISITGGAKDFEMKPKILRPFRRGLLKVARTTGAWIITGGMNTGIMKLVGEIVQINPDPSRPIPLIGIATWGYVSGHEQLDAPGIHAYYSKFLSNKKGEAPLESNHTNFIFVDDGSERRHGGEIVFRSKLEEAISDGFFSSKTQTNALTLYRSFSVTQSLPTDSSDIVPVPVVLIVVEGGPNTVRTVKEAVVENNIPAVLLEGTGRCCDLFAKALHLYKGHYQHDELANETLINRDEEIKNKLREELKDAVYAIDGPSDPTTPTNKRNDSFELVYECLHKRRNFLNVINLNSRDSIELDFGLIILKALLNATSGSDTSKQNMQCKLEKQLYLALEWDRVDIAKDFVKNDADWNINLRELFLLALRRNRTAFVELFLDHDSSLMNIFNDPSELRELYMATDEMKEYHGLSGECDTPLGVIHEVIQQFVEDHFEITDVLSPASMTPNSELINENDDEISICCGRKHYRKPPDNEYNSNVQTERSTTDTVTHINVEKELFLWSIIAGRRDLALLLWSRGKNKICAALIAKLIYQIHAHRKNDNSYYESADEFENLAVQILDKLNQTNAALCRQAIIRQIPAYGNANWLELAVAADAKHFIAQRAIQTIFREIWFGSIDQRVTNRAIVFSTFMLWYSGFLSYQNELVKIEDKTALHNDSIKKSYLYEKSMSKTVYIGDRCKTKITQYFSNIGKFVRAPYIKYLYNLYFHVIFLLLFSYLILCDFFPLYDFQEYECGPSQDSKADKDSVTANDNNPSIINHTSSNNQYNASKSKPYGFQRRNKPSNIEILLAIWVFTLLCEEIRQLWSIKSQSNGNPIMTYLKTFWNKLDVLSIILFFVGFILRFIPVSECFCAARIVLSIDLSLWFIRSLDMFASVRRLGPKLVMISEMVNDMKFFIFVFFVFILAFGIPFYGLVHGVKKFSWHMLREIGSIAYWQIFGELMALETVKDNYSATGYAASILLAAYMFILAILLVNLLIAMFSNTFDRLHVNADRIWKFQRYSLVCEYLARPALPPPFIFFSHLWRLMWYILACWRKSKFIKEKYAQHVAGTEYKISLDEKKSANIEIVEDALGDEVYFKFLKTGRQLVDNADLDDQLSQPTNDNVSSIIRILENRMQKISTQQAQFSGNLELLMDGLKTSDSVRRSKNATHGHISESLLLNSHLQISKT
ncbi:unnamed protein product [Rotaria sp. Silwood1]|nr:unnamed protein product [Rotaria sp. Silwood1]CAF1631601.1 unnamed protein product [Rotaria sp. Silwood1]